MTPLCYSLVAALALASCALGSPRAAAIPPPADQPHARTDANSQLAHEQLLKKAKSGRIDVYFIGDSITRRWGATDPQYAPMLANWKENFFGRNAANFGWGGDRTENILWRLQHGELDGVHPKIIVVLAGTNNLAQHADDAALVEDVARGVQAILAACREKAPRATIVLTAIFPRDDIAVGATIDRINAKLATLADGKQIRYLNLNDKLTDSSGKLHKKMTPDGLHLSVEGYQVWADALKPILSEILGPPSKVDHAPPPTGDPSVTRVK